MGEETVTVMDVADMLRQAKRPARQLDVAIARIIGFRRTVTTTGTVFWVHEKAAEGDGSVPKFTSSIDWAYWLAMIVSPKGSGGFTFGRVASHAATVDDIEPCESSHPALALCAAAMTAKARNEADKMGVTSVA